MSNLALVKMLRSILLFSVLGLFMGFTIGIPLHKHYCGDQLFSAGLVAKDCCCEDTAEEPDDCCKSEIDVFNIDDHYDISKVNKVKLQLPYFPVVNDFPGTYSPVQPNKIIESGEINGNKPPGKVPLHLLHHQLITYG